MNIHITAGATAILPNGKEYPVEESFNCSQTPTRVTDVILTSSDPIQAYKDWILENAQDEEQEVYDFDQWCEETNYYKLGGTETYNWGVEHVKELDNWLEHVNSLGLTVEVYSA
jgi:hypothetical protein